MEVRTEIDENLENRMAKRGNFSCKKIDQTLLVTRVTRLGEFMHFGKLFKAGGNINFAQIAHIIRQFL